MLFGELLTLRQNTAQQVKGFTLYAIRTILSGRGDELVDLADTNVFRRLFD